MPMNSIVYFLKCEDMIVDNRQILLAEDRMRIPFPPMFKKFLVEWGGYEVKFYDEDEDVRCGILFDEIKPGRGYIIPDCSHTFEGMMGTFGDSCLPRNCLCFEHHALQGDIFIDLTTENIWFLETDIYGKDMDDYYRDFLSYEEACDAFDPKNGVVPTYFTKIADNIFDMLDEKRFVVIPDNVPG
ncbi:hypothetical protein QCD60_15685 [Pokkaliibacter sp. MBI-7]|uniref:hypothetical protein n=1 Tax=Pokkaliibacter sp. MBI-7 TaxID=3040600 RepID=UPI00244C7E84|nr:hypothetical protein [Pokkaliibacter sp. MBI-7]MDH2434008.1 hypothetical protein [Pokkaliibacter sp. MBI-7]